MPCTGVELTGAITCLDYNLNWDISGAAATVTITNNSTVSDYASLKWWFYVGSPSGVAIYGTDITTSLPTPDVDGVSWTTKQIPLPTPFTNSPCGQIEFSPNSPYVVKVFVQDATVSPPLLSSLTKNSIIVRPNGCTQNTCGNFGQAAVSMKVDCATKVIMCFDGTNRVYNNILAPTSTSNKWTLVYPINDAGDVPNETATDVPNANFLAAGNSKAYALYFDETATYDYGNGISVTVKYKLFDKSGLGLTFAVNCNTNLCQLQCMMKKYEELGTASCGELEIAGFAQKMAMLNWKYAQILTGIFQPLCGIDVPALIDEMKAMMSLGEDCGCDCQDCGDNFGFSNPTGSGAVAGSTPNLQQVTDIGNTTTNSMLSGSSGGSNSIMNSAGFQVREGVQSVAGLGAVPSIADVGTLYLNSVGGGTVYISAKYGTNTYVLALPPDQGGAGQVMVNNGSGQMDWADTPNNPNLQAVTAIGNATTLDMISGDISGDNLLMNALKVGLRTLGTTDVAYFLNAAGAGRVVLKSGSSAFTTTIQSASALASARVFFTPAFRGGVFALTGNGLAPTVLAGVGAGSGGSATVISGSDDVKGRIAVLVGSGSTTGIIATVTYNTPYDGPGIQAPVPMLMGVAGPASELSGADQVSVDNYTVNGFNIVSGGNALAAGNYAWYYSVSR